MIQNCDEIKCKIKMGTSFETAKIDRWFYNCRVYIIF